MPLGDIFLACHNHDDIILKAYLQELFLDFLKIDTSEAKVLFSLELIKII